MATAAAILGKDPAPLSERATGMPQLGGYAVFAPFNNFRGKGPVPVGSLDGPAPFGAFDMAGNVKQWCSTEIQSDRLVRGGAPDDNTYMGLLQSEWVNSRA